MVNTYVPIFRGCRCTWWQKTTNGHHSCQPHRFWRDSTDNLPTVPPPRPNALLHRLTCACSFKVLCAGCACARAWAQGEFCGSVEPRLYFPRGAATACFMEGRVAPRCNGRKAYTVYLLKIRQVKNNYCSGLPKQLDVKLQYSYRNAKVPNN